MMRSRAVILILITFTLINTGSSLGQSGPDRINIQAGINIFGDPASSSESYVEFPFSVNRDQFEFTREETTGWLKAAIFAEIVLMDTLENHIDSTSTYFYTRVKDSTEIEDENIKLFNKLSLMINPGIYRASLTVIDVTNKRDGTFLYDRIEIDSIDHINLSLSNLELAYDIKLVEDSVSAGRARLIKNDREVLSSPMGVFSEKDTSLYVYAELYNLRYDENIPDSFEIGYRVLTEEGSLFSDLGRLNVIKPGPSAVISNVIDISDWTPGKYDLELTATDLGTGASTESVRRIIIFPEAGFRPSMSFAAYRSPLDTASLETKVNMAKYVINPDRLNLFNSLTDSGKSRFIDQLFKERDPTPETQRNEFLDDVFERYVYANENFSSYPGAGDGWKSDRGRVLMQYGRFDNIEEGISPAYTNPWETWYYNSLQGGVYFIFQDVDGYGNYELVHSTAAGEKYSPEWEATLRGRGMEPIMK